MYRRITAGLLGVTLLMGVGLSSASAARVSERPGHVATVGASRSFDASLGIGTHLYLHLNRTETVKLVSYSSTFAAASYAVLVCSALIRAGSYLSAAICAGMGAMLAQFVQEATSWWLINHPNLCVSVAWKYIPFTDPSHAYWRYC